MTTSTPHVPNFIPTPTQAEHLQKVLSEKQLELLFEPTASISPSLRSRMFRSIIGDIKSKIPRSVFNKTDTRELMKNTLLAGEVWSSYHDADFEDIWAGSFAFSEKYVSTARDAFEDFLRISEAEFDCKTKLFNFKKLHKRSEMFQNKAQPVNLTMNFFNEFLTDLHGDRQKPFQQRNAIESSIETYMAAKLEVEKAKLMKKIAYDPDPINRTHRDMFIEALFGKDRSKVVDWGIEKLLHQIKRKLYFGANNPKYPILYHLVPFLYSTQGAGKTLAVSKLMKVIDPFCMSNAGPETITHEGFSFMFSENYAILIDEAEKLTGTDIGRFKTIVTATELPARRMRTQIIQNIPNNASWIINSNHRLNKTILDVSGNRRFLELVIQKRKYKKVIINDDGTNTETEVEDFRIDFDLLFKVDPVKVWQSIDPESDIIWDSNDDYVRQEIESFQAPSKAKDSVEIFMDDKLERTNIVSEYSIISDLYNTYKTYAEESGFRAVTKTHFKSRLQEICKDEKVRNSKGTAYPYKIVDNREKEEKDLADMIEADKEEGKQK